MTAQNNGQWDVSLEDAERAWTAAVLSTVPADRSAAEAAIAPIYRAIGLGPPRRIIWADGPLDLATSREQVAAREDIGHCIQSAVNEKLAHANCTFRESVRADPLYWRRHALLDTYGNLGQSISMLLEEDTPHLRSGLWRRKLRAFLTGARKPTAWLGFAGSSRSQFDALYLCSQSHLYGRYGLFADSAQLLEHLARLVTRVGWFVPHQHVCWLAERPAVLRVDPRGRLHAARGPAIRCRDGWEVHAWKGVRISPALTEQPDAINVGRIDREVDPLMRRCMIELLTPATYIALGGATVVARDEIGVLWQKSWALDTWAAVEVTNGTPEPDGSYKQYYLQVPPTMRSPRQAVAWTYGLTEGEYAHLALRT